MYLMSTSTTGRKIFRFKLSDDCNAALADFTQKHHFNIQDRKLFRDDWRVWCSQNKDVIDLETRRLENIGYKGDCVAKMFTSVRYYHAKKLAKQNEDEGMVGGEVPATEKKKRSYIVLDKAFLQKIDAHIKTHLTFDNFRPSVGYDLFMNTFTKDIDEQRKRVCTETFTENHFILKLKKTYKNRYFNLVNSTE